MKYQMHEPLLMGLKQFFAQGTGPNDEFMDKMTECLNAVGEDMRQWLNSWHRSDWLLIAVVLTMTAHSEMSALSPLERSIARDLLDVYQQILVRGPRPKEET